jgi:hypothetical protein
MQEDSIKHSRQKSSLKQQNTAYHRSIVWCIVDKH